MTFGDRQYFPRVLYITMKKWKQMKTQDASFKVNNYEYMHFAK